MKYEVTNIKVDGEGGVWVWYLVSACLLGIMITDVMTYFLGTIHVDGPSNTFIPPVVWIFSALTMIMGGEVLLLFTAVGEEELTVWDQLLH